MADKKRFACSDCYYEFYADQNSTGENVSLMRCPKCGSSNIHELDFWGLKKRKDWGISYQEKV